MPITAKVSHDGLHADGLAGFTVGDHEVVFAGSRIAAEDLDAAFQLVGLLENHTDQEGHGNAVPVPHAASAHLTDRNPLGVHAGDGTDEAGISHVHERDLAAGLGDGQDRMVLQAPVAAVIKNPAVVQRAVLCGGAAECETGTMKQLGNEIGDDDVLNVNAGAVGNTAHLIEESFGDVFALLRDDALDDTLGVEQLDALDLDSDLLGLHLEQKADVLANVITEQGALLVAHFIRMARDVQHPVAVSFFEEAGPASGEGLAFGVRGRNCRGEDQEPGRRRLQRDSPHEWVSFCIPRIDDENEPNCLRLESIPRITEFQQ